MELYHTDDRVPIYSIHNCFSVKQQVIIYYVLRTLRSNASSLK